MYMYMYVQPIIHNIYDLIFVLTMRFLCHYLICACIAFSTSCTFFSMAILSSSLRTAFSLARRTSSSASRFLRAWTCASS